MIALRKDDQMIRDATEEDFGLILDMCAEFWKHTLYDEPFDYEHTLTMVKMAFDHGLLSVVDIDGPKGFLAAIRAPLLASKEAQHAVELAYWINPDHRKGTAALKLMKHIESKAKLAGVKYFNFISMESSNPRLAEKIYSKMGYSKSETSFTKVI